MGETACGRLPPGALHRGLRHPRPQAFWEGGRFVGTGVVLAEGRHTSRALWTGMRFQVTRLVHILFALSICLAAAHRYLPNRSLYLHLEPHFWGLLHRGHL